MDSKPKRQLTDQQRANLAAGREKLKTLRADPEYAKQQREKRELLKQSGVSAASAAPVSGVSGEEVVRKRSRSRGRSNAAGSESEAYSKSVPTLGNTTN